MRMYRWRLAVIIACSLVAACASRVNAQSASASYIGTDTTTQGNWRLAYGTDGLSIAGDSQSFPGSVSFSIQNQSNYTWASSTTDVRAPQTYGGTGRVAGTWYSASSYTLDLNLTDGNAHIVSLYALDWDSYGRSESFQIQDAATHTVLDTRSITSFSNGIYLKWTITGHVSIVVTNTGPGNAVVSAVFVDGPPAAITSVSPTIAPAATSVTISGANFGATQGSSTVKFNGTSATTIATWTNTQIVATVPNGATSGPVIVAVNGVNSNSVSLTVPGQPQSGWFNLDIGAANVAGVSSYSNNVFTVQGSGYFNSGASTDGFQYTYRPLSGDGSIVARVRSVPTSMLIGLDIRNSLDANAPNASMSAYYSGSSVYAYAGSRLTTGANNILQTPVQNLSIPMWIKVSRSGNTFTSFMSADGVYWAQVGTSTTITMGASVYAGMFVSGGGNWSLSSGTFDDVQVTSTSAPGPIIGGISSTTGTTGTSVNVWGSGYGATQSSGAVLVNGTAATITSWSATAITFTIPSGATTGPLVVSAAPDLLDSNPIQYTVTSSPLPSGWLDRDFATAGGSASYSNHQFTVHGVGGLSASGGGYVSADSGHFAYQTLSGDGTIIARVISETDQFQNAGVMMRDSLDAGAVNAAVTYYNSANWAFWYRLIANTNNFAILCSCNTTTPPPYWVKLVRSGNGFSPFFSVDGLNWQLAGPSTSLEMGASIYVGLFSTTGTAVFDNVSITSAASPSSTPVITSLSSSTGSVGSQIIISGSNFGATQGNSKVLLSDAEMTVNLWNDTSITVTVPSGAVTGPLSVVLAPSMNSSNGLLYTVTTQPLASGWYDFPVGGAPGDASYNSGVFTVHTDGSGFGGGADQFHYVYQPLDTDGTIIVRVASLSGNSTAMQAGVVVRQTLDAFSADAVGISNAGFLSFLSRPIPGGVSSQQNSSSVTLPYWLKLVRSGNTFAAYASPSGLTNTWSQIGSVQTNSTHRVLIGFGVGGGNSATQITATFDNVSLTAGGSVANPVATGMSPASGPAQTPVTINGTGFGTTVGSVTFNGIPAASITSWGDTSIVALVPDDATSGPAFVTAGNITTGGGAVMNFNVVLTAIVTDSLGNQSTYHSSPYGGQFHFTDSTGSGCSTCSVRGTIQNQYDSLGNRLWVTDELGHTTFDQFDSANNLTAQTVFPTRTTSAKTAYTYNSLGEVTTVTDALGNVTTNSYDSHGNLTGVSSSTPGVGTMSTTTFGYDTKGELTSITDPLNHVTTIAYNSVGLISSITDAQSNATSYGYDSRGNRTSVTDALNHTTTFTFDTGDRLTQITYPDSTTTSFAYDSRGRRTSVTDQNGKTTSYTYDDADRPLTVTDAANNVTTYGYDAESNLTSITDANGHATYFTYDAFGRVTQTNFPSSHVESYAYDAVGNLTSKTDRKGNTIQYVYDGINRLSRKLYPDSTEVDYVYDLVGRIQQVNDPTGTYQFAYDGMSRLTGTTTNYSFLTGRSFTTSYSYDAASNRTGFTDPESGSTTYAYDTLNRLQTLTPPSAFTTGSFGFSYDALSRRTQMTRPNSVTTNYAFDNLSRLTSVLHQLAGSTIDGATYAVDNVGNRTARTDNRTNVTTNYGYDAIYQLLSAAQGATTTESYTYDPVGNRTASLGVSSYTTNSSNELTAMTGTSFTYDYNGNTLTKVAGSNTTGYAWDFENRLMSVTLPGSGGTVSFKYDPFGRRIYKSSSSGTSIFAYDGDNLIEEANSSGAVVARYSQGLNIDEPLAMLRSSATSYFNADGLGSITSLANTSGTLAQTYTFDSFGKQTASSGSLTNSFQFTARESDAETGLYYYRARYYELLTGRFLSEDPAEFESGGPTFYAYVANDPLDEIDPSGLLELIDVSNAIAGAGDSLSFGGTALVRRLMNDGCDPADTDSRAYKAGEAAEVAVEIALTLGSASLKQAAKQASREAERRAARAITRNIVRGDREVLHHINPLFGHPGGFPTLFPTGGLPAAIHSGPLNRELVKEADHAGIHRAMRALEKIGAAVVNPATTTGRILANAIGREDCGCN